jgi:hypothetical protein
MRAFILSAALVVVSRSASAQDPLTSARKMAQKAVSATNAHTEAEQHPAGQATKAAAPAATAPVASKSAAAAAPAPASKPTTVASNAKGSAPRAGDKATAIAAAAPAPDTAGPPPTIYRESFVYGADGRRDPFNSLLSTNELRPAISDLRLTGVLYDHTGRHSVATLRDLGTNAQYRVTTGSTLGRMRVSIIRYTTVVFTIDEFGTTRQDSLVLRDTTKARGK